MRHPGVAGALLVGAAYPHVDGPLSELTRTFLGVDDTSTPGVAHVEANFGDQADGVDVARLRGPQTTSGR